MGDFIHFCLRLEFLRLVIVGIIFVAACNSAIKLFDNSYSCLVEFNVLISGFLFERLHK